MDKVIDIYAPLRNWTGYAEVVRNLVWRLYVLGWKINFEEFKGWSSVGMKLTDEQEKFFSMLENNKYPSDRHLSICLPEQAKLFPDKLNINLTMFEAKRKLPKLWIETSKKIDHIIVPTKQNYRMWYDNLGMPFNKLSLLRFGVSVDDIKNANVIPVICQDTGVDVCKEYKYQLLVLQEYISRKNLKGVLRAFYLGCIKNKERYKDTCLVLKLNSNSGDKLSGFKVMCDNLKQDIEEQYKVELPHNLFVYTDILADNYMYSLFNSFTHYFSMSNGEGWDMNCMKAVALGKTAIVPESSSYIEYLDKDKAHLIPCNEGKFQIEENNLNRIYAESLWDCPDVDAASDYIANIDSIGQKDCSEHILTYYNWEACARQLDIILRNVSIDKPAKEIDYSYASKKTVLMVCKTIGKRCGIGEYTKTLHKKFDEANVTVVTVSSDEYSLWEQVNQFYPEVVHIQNEYQFYTPKRLLYLVNRLKERNIKLLLTQHTFNENVYELNKLFVKKFDKIITHNKYVVDGYVDCFGESVRDKVLYAPMPVERVMTEDIKKQVPYNKIMAVNGKDIVENDNELRIGFFGFCYYHKGLDRLITSIRNVVKKYNDGNKLPIMLYIFSSKPEQDYMNYYEQCISLIESYNIAPYVKWNATYFKMDELLARLHHLDIICMPYDHYGSFGASAALATAAQAEGPQLICSKESPFFDVENKYAPNIQTISNDDLESYIDDCFVKHLYGVKVQTKDEVWDTYFEDRSWIKFAKQLGGIYENFLNG